MKILRSSRSQDGSILVVSLCAMLIVGVALFSFLTLGKNQNQLVTRSQVWNACLPLAEAGVEDALNHATWNSSNWNSSGWSLSGSNTFYRSNIVVSGEGWYRTIISTNSMTSNYITITSTGYQPMPGSPDYVPRTVQVLALKVPSYRFALYGKSSVDFNGNGIRVDSYDSRDAAKSTGGLYDSAKAGDSANVGTYNGTPNANYDIGNANIWGHVYMGANGVVKVGSNGKVGSVSYQSTGAKGTIQAGWVRTDLNISIPDVKVPFSAGVPALPGIVGGKLYSYVFSSGSYVHGTLSGEAIVTGDALIWVTGNIDLDKLVVSAGATVYLYCGGTVHFKDTDNQSQRAVNMQVLGLPSCKTVDLDDGFMGAVYAPEATIKIAGSKQIYGSVAANNVRLTGGSDIHYDEAVGTPSGKGTYIITSWTEL